MLGLQCFFLGVQCIECFLDGVDVVLGKRGVEVLFERDVVFGCRRCGVGHGGVSYRLSEELIVIDGDRRAARVAARGLRSLRAMRVRSWWSVLSAAGGPGHGDVGTVPVSVVVGVVGTLPAPAVVGGVGRPLVLVVVGVRLGVGIAATLPVPPAVIDGVGMRTAGWKSCSVMSASCVALIVAVLQAHLENLEQQVIAERELDGDLALDRGGRHGLQRGGPGDVADAPFRLDLQHLQPRPVGLRRQPDVGEILLLLRGQRHGWRLHADLLVDEGLCERHAGVEAAAPHRGVLARSAVSWSPRRGGGATGSIRLIA